MRPQSVFRTLAQPSHPSHLSRPQVELLEDRCSPGALALLGWLWGLDALPGDNGSVVFPGAGELHQAGADTYTGSGHTSGLGSSDWNTSVPLPDSPIPRNSTEGAGPEGYGEPRDQSPAGLVSILASGPS